MTDRGTDPLNLYVRGRLPAGGEPANPERGRSEREETMTRPFFVAIYKTNTKANQKDELPARQNKLNFFAKKAHQEITSLLESPVAEAHSLFVAPEYLFANPNTERDHRVGDERHVDETSKVGIEKFIKELSEACPGMILIPGSVAWKKSFWRDEDMYVKNKQELDKALEKGKLSKHFRARTEARAQKAMDVEIVAQPNPKLADDCTLTNIFKCGGTCGKVAEEKTKKEKSGRICLICKKNVTPDSYEIKCDNCGSTFTVALKQAGFVKCNACPKIVGLFNTPGLFEAISSDQAKNMTRNTSYVYLNGTRYLKYHKQAGCQEVLTTGGVNVFVPGNKVGFVKIDGIKLGLEICFDHTTQRLQKTLSEKPDLHVIVSAFVEPKVSQVHVKDNGYVVSASSKVEYCMVYKGPGLIEQKDPTPVGLVDIYKIELNL
jgi:hypothetical protein